MESAREVAEVKAPVPLWPFVGALLYSVLTGLPFYAFVQLGPVLERKGFDPATAAALVTVPWFLRALVGPWVGRWSDRTGHRAVLSAGAILTAIASLAYLATDTIGWWPVRIFHGLAIALPQVALDGYLAKILPPRWAPTGWGIVTALYLGCSFAGPAAGEWMLRLGGPRALFLVSGVAAALATPLALLARPERLTDPRGPAGWLSTLKTAADPRFRGPILFAALGGTLSAAHAMVPYLVSGGKLTSSSRFFIPLAVAAVITKLFAGTLSRLMRVNVLLLLGGGLAIAGIATTAIGFDAVVVGAAVVQGVGIGVFFPAIYVAVGERARAGEAGMVLGLVSSTLYAGTFLVSLALGQATSRAGIAVAFPLAAAIGTGLAVLAHTTRPR